MKLTTEQIAELQNAFSVPMFPSSGIERLIAAYHEMIAASDTHRIVEAPEGYTFDNKCPPAMDIRLDHQWPFVEFGFTLRHAPVPCPPPKLEPVPPPKLEPYEVTLEGSVITIRYRNPEAK